MFNFNKSIFNVKSVKNTEAIFMSDSIMHPSDKSEQSRDVSKLLIR
jgi:hypothetical protein